MGFQHAWYPFSSPNIVYLTELERNIRRCYCRWQHRAYARIYGEATLLSTLHCENLQLWGEFRRTYARISPWIWIRWRRATTFPPLSEIAKSVCCKLHQLSVLHWPRRILSYSSYWQEYLSHHKAGFSIDLIESSSKLESIIFNSSCVFAMAIHLPISMYLKKWIPPFRDVNPRYQPTKGSLFGRPFLCRLLHRKGGLRLDFRFSPPQVSLPQIKARKCVYRSVGPVYNVYKTI